jgi:hypothetical protein
MFALCWFAFGEGGNWALMLHGMKIRGLLSGSTPSSTILDHWGKKVERSPSKSPCSWLSVGRDGSYQMTLASKHGVPVRGKLRVLKPHKVSFPHPTDRSHGKATLRCQDSDLEAWYQKLGDQQKNVRTVWGPDSSYLAWTPDNIKQSGVPRKLKVQLLSYGSPIAASLGMKQTWVAAWTNQFDRELHGCYDGLENLLSSAKSVPVVSIA